MDWQILKLARARVGGATKNDNAFIRTVQKRLKRFGSQIRMNRNRIRLQILKRHLYITCVGIADIRTLGIQNYRYIRRDDSDVGDGSVQSRDALFAMSLVESNIRLIRAYKVFRRFHNCAVECDNCVSETHVAFIAASERGFGNLAEFAIQPDTDKVAFIPLRFQHFHEISVVHLYCFSRPIRL